MTAVSTGSETTVRSALRETPAAVRYLLVGVLINQLGAFVQTFLILYLVHRGLSADRAGALLAVYAAGAVFGTMLGGELTQRFGPRRTIVTAMAGSAVFVAAVPELARPDLTGPLALALGAAGLITQAYRPAAALLLGEMMPTQHRVMGFSMMRIAMNAGAALAPLLAAGLILLDWNLLYWVDAATAAIYATVALVLLPAGTTPPVESETDRATTGYGVILRDRRYAAFLASVLLGTLIYVQYTVALPLHLARGGHPTGWYAAVLVTASVVLIAFELPITAFVSGKRGDLVGAVGTAIMGAGVAGYLFAGSAVAVVPVATAVFVAGVMINGPTMFAYPSTFPAAVRARYVAAHQAVFGIGLAIGPLLGVLAWNRLGAGIWPLCGGLGLLAAWCAYLGMPARTDAESTGH